MSALEKGDQTRATQLGLLALDCYIAAVKNTAHYALELPDEITERHRKYMNTLADEVEEATEESLAESRATLRGLLRDYRDKAAKYLNQLREELANTAGALQEILNTLSQTEGDHEVCLRQSVKTLRQLAESGTAATIRTALLRATDTIETSVESLHRQHKLMVTQFQTEIRVLHKRIDALESAVAFDDLTRLLSPAEMEKRIYEADTGGSLLLVKARGFRRLEKEFSREVSSQLAGAFLKRLRNSMAPTTALGRWSDEEFIAQGDFQKPEAVTIANWIADHLSGAYTFMQEGKSFATSIQVEIRVVDRARGEEAEATLAQVREYLKG